MAEEPDIIEHGHGRALPRLALPRRAATAIVAGTAATVLVAGSVLAVVRPWSGSSGLHDACALVPAATVANLVPAAAGRGPAVFTSSTATTQMCTWQTTGGTLLSVDVEHAPSKGLARQDFSVLPSAAGPALAAAIRPLPGIGDQAQAVLATGFPGEVAVYVRVLSGSTLFGIGYNSPRAGHTPVPGEEAVLAELVPASRTVLSRLAATLSGPARTVSR